MSPDSSERIYQRLFSCAVLDDSCDFWIEMERFRLTFRSSSRGTGMESSDDALRYAALFINVGDVARFILSLCSQMALDKA